MKNLIRLGLFVFLISALASCKGDKGQKADVSAKATKAAQKGKSYNVNTATSKVLWEGSKPAGAHNGSLNVSNGNVCLLYTSPSPRD